MGRGWQRVGGGALTLSVVLGCGASGLQGQELHHKGFDLRVGPLPPSWRPIELSGTLAAFRDENERGTVVAINGRCGKDGDDVPLTALTQHLFLYFTHRETLSTRTLQLDRREALRTEISAELDGVPRHLTVYVLKKNGCVYDFQYIQASDGTSSGRESFDRFVTEFRTLGER